MVQIQLHLIILQDSPPSGNCKRRTARGLTCPSVACLGGGGRYPSPRQGVYPSLVRDVSQFCPAWRYMVLAGGKGHPSPILWGGGVYPCPSIPSCLGLGYTPPPGAEVLFTWYWGTPPPTFQKLEQTDTCENITSRHITYAGGKNKLFPLQSEVFWIVR